KRINQDCEWIFDPLDINFLVKSLCVPIVCNHSKPANSRLDLEAGSLIIGCRGVGDILNMPAKRLPALCTLHSRLIPDRDDLYSWLVLLGIIDNLEIVLARLINGQARPIIHVSVRAQIVGP